MKNQGLKNISEDKSFIIFGIIGFYLLVILFFIYMYILHRMSVFTAGLFSVIFTGIYFPRFFIIKKILSPDKINITDNSINVNGQNIDLAEIEDYRTRDEKPQVIFFINSKTVIFNETIFHLKLRQGGQISFSAIGSEKISLLKEFFNELLGK